MKPLFGANLCLLLLQTCQLVLAVTTQEPISTIVDYKVYLNFTTDVPNLEKALEILTEDALTEIRSQLEQLQDDILLENMQNILVSRIRNNQRECGNWQECATVKARADLLLSVDLDDPDLEWEEEASKYEDLVIVLVQTWLATFNVDSEALIYVEYLNPVKIAFVDGLILKFISVLDDELDGSNSRYWEASGMIWNTTAILNEFEMNVNETAILEQAVRTEGVSINPISNLQVRDVDVISQHLRLSYKDPRDQKAARVGDKTTAPPWSVENHVRLGVQAFCIVNCGDLQDLQDEYENSLALSLINVFNEVKRLAEGNIEFQRTDYFEQITFMSVVDAVDTVQDVAAVQDIPRVVQSFDDPVEEEDFAWYLLILAAVVLLILGFCGYFAASRFRPESGHNLEGSNQQLLSPPVRHGERQRDQNRRSDDTPRQEEIYVEPFED